MPNQSVKLLFSLLCVLIFAFLTTAQTKCELPNAPKLLNLNLGMSVADVKNVFGKELNIKVKTKGDKSFFQNYIDKPAKNSLRGLRALYLRFLDGRLYQIEIFYENRADWPTLSDFTKALAAQMNFAEDVWQIKQNKALIDCGEFSVFANNVLNPHVEITNAADYAAIKEIRRKKN